MKRSGKVQRPGAEDLRYTASRARAGPVGWRCIIEFAWFMARVWPSPWLDGPSSDRRLTSGTGPARALRLAARTGRGGQFANDRSAPNLPL